MWPGYGAELKALSNGFKSKRNFHSSKSRLREVFEAQIPVEVLNVAYALYCVHLVHYTFAEKKKERRKKATCFFSH